MYKQLINITIRKIYTAYADTILYDETSDSWNKSKQNRPEYTKNIHILLNKDRPTWCHLLYYFII